MKKVNINQKRKKLTHGVRVNRSCICRGHCVCSKQAIDPKVG